MERDLIDAYLVELRRTLAGRRDVDDVLDEVADHLRENVSRLVAQGAADADAQRRTLECFGDLGVVARAFVETSSGELAVPSRFTRRAGSLGLAAAACWVGGLVLGLVGAAGDLLDEWSEPRYVAYAIVMGLATVLSTLTMIGALRRAGALRTLTGAVCTVLMAGTAVVVLALTWAIAVVMPVFAVGVLIGSSRLGPAGRLRRPAVGLALTWLVGFCALYLGDEVYGFGPVNQYGDYPLVWTSVLVGTSLGSAATLAVLGHRLRGERPVDVGDLPPVVPLAG